MNTAVIKGQRVLYVGEALPEGVSAVVAEGLVRRRLAALTGTCPCGAAYSLPPRAVRRAAARRGEALTGAVLHEDDCAAIAAELDAYLAGAA